MNKLKEVSIDNIVQINKIIDINPRLYKVYCQ